jgi:hypothetical protein
VKIHVVMVQVTTLFSLVSGLKQFRGKYCFSLQYGRWKQYLKMLVPTCITMYVY